MSLSEGVRTRTQKIATLHSEEMSVRFSAHSIVHYSEIEFMLIVFTVTFSGFVRIYSLLRK